MSPSFRQPIQKMMFALLLLVSLPAVAVDEVFETGAGAIRGYDPVAYHVAGAAVEGSPAIAHVWNGATWHFASAANRDLFAADPHKYAPAYGGYCAYGTSQGYKVSSDPAAFAIVGGRLYLNYSPAVLRTWNRDREGYIRAADRNWVGLEARAHDPE
jgi:YHS domain-containing protein